MKHVFLLVSLFSLTAITASAQSINARNAVKINPLSLFLATGNVSYERAIGDQQSAQLGVFYSGMSIGDVKYSGLGITPEYRFYFAGRKEALNGVYAAPFLRYQSFTLKEKESSNNANYSSFGGGAVMGWEKNWNSGLVLDLFAGPAYNKGKFKNESDEDDFDLSSGVMGFGVCAGIVLGFSF